MAGRGLSNREAATAVGVALVVGIVGSLALRGPATTGPARGAGEASPQRHWRLPVAFGTNLPALGDNALFVAEAIGASSGGRLRVEVFEPGELVPPFSITDAVADAKVQAGYTWLGYDQGKLPWTVLFGAVPFGMEPWEFTGWWWHGGGRELAVELYEPVGLHPLLCGIIGPESAGWFREEIASLEDIRGLKIRFAGLGGMVLQRLGASVTMLPGGEIFQALEKGAIDATEFSLPSVDQRLGFDRVVSYNYFPGWHQPATGAHLVVNLALWRGLTDAERAWLETSCTAGVARNLAHAEAIQGGIIAGASERGVHVRSLPTPVLRELERVSEEVLAEEATRDADFRRVWESQRAYREAYRHWKRVGFLPRDF